MIARAIILLVIIGGTMIVALLVAAAWLHQLWAHRDRQERSLADNIDRLGRLQTVQFIVTLGFGLIAGLALCLGWTADYCQ